VTTLQRFNCRAYDWLLLRCDDSLLFNYGEELRTTFRDELAVALERGPSALLRLWCFLIYDTLTVVGPEYLKALSVAAGAIITAGVLVLGTALGFCSLHGISVVQGCERFEGQSITPPGNSLGRSVLLSNGHSMFLECSGDPHPGPTVILATGRGLGSYEAWSLVQARITPFAHVCSFDPLGYGKSDHVPGDHPVDEVAANMHDLFSAAHLNGPYILVGASLGGVLIRRYEQLYPLDVAGFVFVDSAHEEMEWRDAQISQSFDPSRNDSKYLQQNGLLPAEQRFTWRDDVPAIVLERTDLPPCSAFPGLTQSQCDRINQAWHDMQVDLSKRSKFGELRPIAGSGHAMQQQKPDAIAQAVHDVLARLSAASVGKPMAQLLLP
jgi:pimeloyl-ACP methyl ester carboxylesterase